MKDRIKDATVVVVFAIVILSIFIINIFSKDKDISNTERRKLASFPEVTKENLINGNLSNNFEKYFSDQFFQRDFFRGLKSFYSLNILKNKDNNELFVVDNSIYKMDYKLSEENIEMSAKKIKDICNNYLTNMNVYYSIIPDKNYYLENDDHLKMDYNRLKNIMERELNELKYIDIWNYLKLDDYYKTDLHWKQENLNDVTNLIRNKMGGDSLNLDDYKLENKGDFYGVYYGQLGIDIAPDKLYILTNYNIENCITYNDVTKEKGKIYNLKNSRDKYDIYLYGAVPLITIENPNCKKDKELLLFRDSFGSSLAPLLIDNYKKITLIDIRYISSKILKEYIDFSGQDVLFLYCTTVLNNNIFK